MVGGGGRVGSSTGKACQCCLSLCVLQDDYLVTSDQLWVPLRWIAPELIDEVHGNLLVVDQTKTSNIW